MWHSQSQNVVHDATATIATTTTTTTTAATTTTTTTTTTTIAITKSSSSSSHSTTTVHAMSSKLAQKKMHVKLSLPCRLCDRNLQNHERCELEFYTRQMRVNISLLCDCVLEIYTRKMCATVSLWCAGSLHKKDVPDGFLTIQAICSKLRMCLTAFLQFTFRTGCVIEVYTRKMCVIVSLSRRLCTRKITQERWRDNFLTVRSQFTQHRYA